MKKSLVRKARKSFIGRALRRFLGDEKGTLVENLAYTFGVVAVCYMAIAAYAGSMSGMFHVLARLVEGSPAESASLQESLKDATDNNFSKAATVGQSRVLKNTAVSEEQTFETESKGK